MESDLLAKSRLTLLLLAKIFRTGISVPEDNVKDASDSSNQRGSYLNDLDWDRPPPYKMRTLRPCCLIHSDSVNLSDHFIYELDLDRPPPLHHVISLDQFHY